ncbi:MAG: IS3 family transposase [Chloroflexota bacterium]
MAGGKVEVGQYKRHSAEFKAKVALEAIKGQRTLNEIAGEYGVHPGQIIQWKKHLLEELPGLFASKRSREAKSEEELKASLYQQIGQLKVELDWLKKKAGVLPAEAKRSLIELGHEGLSLARQCELVGLARSSLYYQPRGVSEENLLLMRLIDEQYTRTPFYGIRRMTAWLKGQGHEVNHKRVARLMETMGLEAIYPKPRTSQPSPDHRVYPYLLRNVAILRPNQVWSTDITYIRLSRGFVYLVAILDWFSRYVLSWEISVSLDVGFCLEALDRALEKGRPAIFNSDQGCQFTSQQFTERLLSRDIRISMDGRGRALDNVFVERLWRTVKQEEVYLKDYETVPAAAANLKDYFQFYNRERLHQSLGYRTPEVVYRGLAG